MKKKFSSKTLKKMQADADRGEWHDLITLEALPSFACWLTQHEWLIQSPDYGEALRAYKNGWLLTVTCHDHHTTCHRLCMALWHTYQCFKE